eukprot:2871550-Karenia_brevis.AAC.1
MADAKCRTLLANAVQNMMADIVEARDAARPGCAMVSAQSDTESDDEVVSMSSDEEVAWLGETI